jgi:diguanylate cyclase (GGDEF)-like protein
MELKAYLHILIHKWWIVIPTFLITLTAVIVLTFTQTPVYQTIGTFVVVPNSSFQDAKNFLSGLDVLSNRTEIASTYAEVAASRQIKQLAADELHLSQIQKTSLSVTSQLLAGTNVLEITVEGNDPALVRDFANLIGVKTVAYVQGLYEVYELKPLDQATLPISPISPDIKLNLALGVILGLGLGAGLAFLSEYLQAPLENLANFAIFDNETGAYNEHYFMQRLREEMSRARRNQYPLSLALMNIDYLGVTSSTPPQVRTEVLRRVVVLLKQHLREEDLVARLNGTVFAVLLPDLSGEEAKETIQKLQTRMTWTPFEMENTGIKVNLNGMAGVAAYQCNGTSHDELIAKASQALEEAETAGLGKICLVSETNGYSTAASIGDNRT